MIPCAQRDALYCLHENGCITLRVCRSTTTPEEGAGILYKGLDTHMWRRGYTTDRGCSLPLCFSGHFDAYLSLFYCVTKSLLAILSIIFFLTSLLSMHLFSSFHVIFSAFSIHVTHLPCALLWIFIYFPASFLAHSMRLLTHLTLSFSTFCHCLYSIPLM